MAYYRQLELSSAERELTRAVRQVHERYGTDLKSFFEDAQKAASTESMNDTSAESNLDGE